MALVFRPPTGRQNCHHLLQLVNTILSDLDCSINVYYSYNSGEPMIIKQNTFWFHFY